MLKSIGNHSQGESLCIYHRLDAGHAIGKDTWKYANFGQPTPIVFRFYFNNELHYLSSKLPGALARRLFTGILFSLRDDIR